MSLIQVPLDAIQLSDFNPRKTFIQDSLEELAQSIRERGVLVPVLVRPTPEGRYEVVAGERRVRASRIAGLNHVPAIVKEYTDGEAATDALLENVQREDMNPIEKARGLRELLGRYPLEQVCRAMGMSETSLRRSVDLLDLPPTLQRALIPRGAEPTLGEGHARVLLSFNDDPETQLRLAEKVMEEKLTVAGTEKLGKAIKDFPDRKEIFLKASGEIGGEMARSLRAAGADNFAVAKARRSQTAAEHLKAMDKLAQGFVDALDPQMIQYLSSEEMNRLLGTMMKVTRSAEVFTHKIRQALDKEEFGFREVYTHCPLCGRVELIGANKCGACWTILRRCVDCGHHDPGQNRCNALREPISAAEAEVPNETSKSFKCAEYRPRFTPRGVPLSVVATEPGGRRI